MDATKLNASRTAAASVRDGMDIWMLNSAASSDWTLTDAWTLRKNDRSSDGDTCCFDTLDAEEAGEVTRRVDLIWLRGAEARGATFRLTGDDPKRTTPEGLYGSDHLGVFGRMTLVPAY